MKTSEHFALDEWLSEYPDELTYDQIIAILRHFKNTWRADEITVWDVLEDCTLDQVAGFIESTRKHFERVTS
tara:strand:- start:310 stop:525 length:216 start_codon:yes stop_codon:yes gene_type:complete